MISHFQKTLHHPITLHGIGVHSGLPVELRLEPAPINHDIVFYRSDLEGTKPIPALFSAVSDTKMSTTLRNNEGQSVSTVEHLMAALSGSGITNCAVYLSGPEMPIMDGSALVFCQAIDQAGILNQQTPATLLFIEQTLRIESKNGWVQIEPAPKRRFTVTFDFYQKLPKVLQQTANLCYQMDEESFKDTIAPARTFGLFEDAEKVRAAGLAKGASLENTIIIGNDGVMNPEGLRHPNELAQHKILDAVGDLALSPVLIIGAYSAYNGSHDLNNQLMHKIFASHQEPSSVQAL